MTDFFTVDDDDQDLPMPTSQRFAAIRHTATGNVLAVIEGAARELVAKLTAWLDAPRLAARKTPEVIASDEDVALLRTAHARATATPPETRTAPMTTTSPEMMNHGDPIAFYGNQDGEIGVSSWVPPGEHNPCYPGFAILGMALGSLAKSSDLADPASGRCCYTAALNVEQIDALIGKLLAARARIPGTSLVALRDSITAAIDRPRMEACAAEVERRATTTTPATSAAEGPTYDDRP